MADSQSFNLPRNKTSWMPGTLFVPRAECYTLMNAQDIPTDITPAWHSSLET